MGLVTGLGFYKKGFQIGFYDVDSEKIESLKKGIISFFEEGAEEVLKNGLANEGINFYSGLEEVVRHSEIIFVAVSTPYTENNGVDESIVLEVSEEIINLSSRDKILVIKSTVSPDTVMKIKDMSNKKGISFAVNPEFLREGKGLYDFLNPDRIVIGVEDEEAKELVLSVFPGFNAPKVITDPITALLIKLASNSFLALKISFINEMANLCDKLGANIDDLSLGLGLDRRIARDFLKSGIGFGGSCLPKDLFNLIDFSRIHGYEHKILKAVKDVNDSQYLVVVKKLKNHLRSLEGKKVTILGVTFKENTDDIRGSVSLKVIDALLREKALLRAHDFAGIHNFKKLSYNSVKVSEDVYVVLNGSDALIFLTSWQEYRKLDWERVKKLMSGNLIVDGRNFLPKDILEKLGFIYEGIGKR